MDELSPVTAAGAAVWDERAGRYRRSLSHRGGADLAAVVRFCKPRPGRTVLDVATGGGHVAARLREWGCAVVTTDVSTAMEPDVVCPAEELPFEAASFEVAVTRLAAHHFADLPRAIREMARVSSDVVVVGDTLWGGVELEEIYRLHDPTHIETHSREEWVRLFSSAGLEVDCVVVVPKTHVFTDWASSTGCSPETVNRLAKRLGERLVDGTWTDTKIVLRGRHPGRSLRQER